MKILKILLILTAVAVMFTSCTVKSHSMKMPNNHVEFTKGDFDFSKQVSGEATQVKILGIDFARIFERKLGEVEVAGALQIPIIGSFIAKNVNLYALYNVMKDNPGYDVVFYPQFETEKTGFPIFFTTTKVKVTARLAKIK